MDVRAVLPHHAIQQKLLNDLTSQDHKISSHKISAVLTDNLQMKSVTTN
jgi:hypothetical protein